MTINESTFHSIEKLPLFTHVIHSKLMEAKQHVNLLKTYTPQLLLTKRYHVHLIMEIHEENNEFIMHMQNSSRAWSQHALTPTQRDTLNLFDKQLQHLETTIYHVLYTIEQLGKPKKGEEQSIAC